jgi:hypothetical protein
MPIHFTRLAFAVLLLGATSPALADIGNGIRFGGSEGRLHPFIELQGGYDSNVFIADNSTTSVGDVILHVRPGLTLEIPSGMVGVNLSANLDWAQYLGIKDSGSKDLSKLYAAAKLGLSVNQRGVVGLQLDDEFRRSNRPQALTAAGNIVTNYNGLDLRLPIRPGGGALTLTLNGSWALESYETLLKRSTCPVGSPVSCDVTKLGYNEVGAGAGVAWKFLPRTSALLEGGYFLRSPNSKLVSAEVSGYRAMTGLSGLITSHIAATLKAGYGGTLSVSPGSGLSTWLATVEGEWLPSETASVKLGYAHDFAVDPAVPVFEAHRVSLTARKLVGGRFSVGGRASWDLLSYIGGGSTNLFQVSPVLGAEVTRWLRAEVAVAYTDRSSSSLGSALTVPSYSKTEAWLNLVATY